MTDLAYLAVAGALGAVGRYLVGGWAYRVLGTDLPWGTLLVNLSGCLLLGFVMQLGYVSVALPRATRLAISVGFLGSFTTFSTFGYETMRYLENGAWLLALTNVALNLMAGLLAVWVGISLAKTIPISV
ncbi:MAG: fluoride efflux transporter CrcB [Candidatus Binatia bacterium]